MDLPSRHSDFHLMESEGLARCQWLLMNAMDPSMNDLGIRFQTQLQRNRDGLHHQTIVVEEVQHRCTNQEDEVGISESQLPHAVVVVALALSPKLVASCFPYDPDHPILFGGEGDLNLIDEEDGIQELPPACRMEVKYQHLVFVVYLKRPC